MKAGFNEAQIAVKFGEQHLELPVGSSLLSMAITEQEKYAWPIVGALYNNTLVDLYTEVSVPGDLEFLDLSSDEGMRIYRQSLVFLLTRAVFELMPAQSVVIEHALGKSYYCEFKEQASISLVELQALEAKMRELVKADEPIICQQLSRENAARMLTAMGFEEKVALINSLPWKKIRLYNSGSFSNYSYAVLAPSTGCLGVFQLEPYAKGFLLCFPSTENPGVVAPHPNLPKLASIFRESEEWAQILGMSSVSGLYQRLERDAQEGNNLIHVAEALHEKKIAQIADEIYSQRQHVRLVLIAGPSSSGKTTFAKRLAVQLRVLGLKPISVSVDDYFVNREKTPLDEFGDYDFEALETVDLPLFNEHLQDLIACKEVACPIFNFKLGQRESTGKLIQAEEGHPIIVEGIHALNELLTESIPRSQKYKIYISALTQISIDDHNRIPTTDSRLIRRIVRDNQYRGQDAQSTLGRWKSVRRGEERNIFPYQEDADIMFNSVLIYELGVFKTFAYPLLKAVEKKEKFFYEAQRLLGLLAHFPEISAEHIPYNSILREFIGGSSFHD